jgi:hypothetical protein
LSATVLDSAAAEDADPDAATRAAVGRFIKAVKAKDVDALLKETAVPWLDAFEERVIKDEADLKKLWQEKLGALDPDNIPAEVQEVESLAKLKALGQETPAADNPYHEAMVASLKALDQVLQKDDRIVTIGSEENALVSMFVLVRIKDGKARIVGGPAGQAWFNGSKIPAAARTALEKAESLELYSLDPGSEEEKPVNNFHGWEILGATTVKGPAKKKLVTAFKVGVEESGGAAAGCFNPRHGIRVKHGGKTYDFVICFECLSVSTFVDEEKGGFLIMPSPQPTFDKILKDARVPLPKPAEE